MSQLSQIKITNPTYIDILPSTKKEIKYRAFRVGDEKTLLMAAESNDSRAMVESIKDVIKNCVDDINVNDLAPFDLEYLFIKLRSVSIGEIADIKIGCEKCDEMCEVKVDISKISIRETEGHTDSIKISDELAFKMKMPDAAEIVGMGNTADEVIDMVSKSVHTVYFNEDTIEIDSKEKEKEVAGLLNQLTTNQFGKVQEFFTTMPKLSKVEEFVCEHCGTENKKTLEGLASFF